MSYALITGASKGIGKAIAEELARRNFNVLLVARSESLLQTLAQNLADKYRIKADYLALDLAGAQAPQQIFDWCRSRQYTIQVLVNNAGYGLSGSFEKYTVAENLDMMHVNMLVPVQLTQLLLPQLRQQSRAYILNIASSAAYQAVPLLSLYAATKAFMLTFSRGLRQELAGSAVSVTCVSPGSTDTDFVQRANIGEKGRKAAQKVNMTAEAVAAVSVESMLAGKAEVIPGLINKLGAFMVWLMPKGLVEKTAMQIYQ
ncbi:SDR family NAD(P)-dependent oxidoreductase [Nibrella viscosa]